MASYNAPFQISGSLFGMTFVEESEGRKAHVRQRSSLDRDKWLRSSSFANSRAVASEFGTASRLAAHIYSHLGPIRRLTIPYAHNRIAAAIRQGIREQSNRPIPRAFPKAKRQNPRNATRKPRPLSPAATAQFLTGLHLGRAHAPHTAVPSSATLTQRVHHVWIAIPTTAFQHESRAGKAAALLLHPHGQESQYTASPWMPAGTPVAPPPIPNWPAPSHTHTHSQTRTQSIHLVLVTAIEYQDAGSALPNLTTIQFTQAAVIAPAPKPRTPSATQPRPLLHPNPAAVQPRSLSADTPHPPPLTR